MSGQPVEFFGDVGFNRNQCQLLRQTGLVKPMGRIHDPRKLGAQPLGLLVLARLDRHSRLTHQCLDLLELCGQDLRERSALVTAHLSEFLQGLSKCRHKHFAERPDIRRRRVAAEHPAQGHDLRRRRGGQHQPLPRGRALNPRHRGENARQHRLVEFRRAVLAAALHPQRNLHVAAGQRLLRGGAHQRLEPLDPVWQA